MTTLIAIIGAVAAFVSAFSVGTLIKFFVERKDEKNMTKKTTEENKQAIVKLNDEMTLIKAMCMGSLYDRTKFLGETYIKRGSITSAEYNDWVKYLYEPYHKGGGDGTIDKIKQEVDKLPLEQGGRYE